LPGSRAASPRKRNGDEFDEDADESDPTNLKKTKSKPTPMTKKVIIKTKPTLKKGQVKANSNLNVEQKADDDDAKDSTVQVAQKKAAPKAGPSPAKKLKLGAAKPNLQAAAPKKAKRDKDAESESSGTLSSPPQ
jgi:hypothetical protein